MRPEGHFDNPFRAALREVSDGIRAQNDAEDLAARKAAFKRRAATPRLSGRELRASSRRLATPKHPCPSGTVSADPRMWMWYSR